VDRGAWTVDREPTDFPGMLACQACPASLQPKKHVRVAFLGSLSVLCSLVLDFFVFSRFLVFVIAFFMTTNEHLVLRLSVISVASC
jgi:hypothetical protein